MKKLRENSVWKYVLAFSAPIIVLNVILYHVGVQIIGGKSILANDLWSQYTPFFTYFQSVFKSEASSVYDFYKPLGGEMTGIVTYYLMSPFNFVLLFFSKEFLPVGIFLITLLKIGMCGLSFEIFCQKTFKYPRYTVVFATMYALMGYNMVYMSHIMWLDGVIALPMIALGIDGIVKQKSSKIYIFALIYAIITNYYIGFMLCIFSVIYFIYRSAVEYVNKKTLGDRCVRFVIASLLSGGSSAIVLLPVLHALSGTKAGFSGDHLQFVSNFHFMDIFSKFYTNTFSWNEFSVGMPNIFCGILVLFLLIFYFVSEHIESRNKLFTCGILFVFLLSFYIKSVNLFWHGMNRPNWFPYRYSFCFVFLILLFAYKSFTVILEQGKNVKKDILISMVIFVVLTVILGIQKYEYWKSGYIVLDVIGVTVFACICVWKRDNSKAITGSFLVLLCIGDLTLNGIKTLELMPYHSNDEYIQEIKQSKNIVAAAKKYFDSDEFYRMEKNYKYTYNEDMIYNYKGITHYSSAIKKNVWEMAEKMGFRTYNVSISYEQGNTVFANSLFGIKSVISNQELGKPYIKLEEREGKYIYENPYAMSLGFGLNESILDHVIDSESVSNPFEYQNEIFKALTGGKNNRLFSRSLFKSVNIVNGERSQINDNIVMRTNGSEPLLIEYEFNEEECENSYMWIQQNLNVREAYVEDKALEFWAPVMGKSYNYIRPLIELENSKVKKVRIEIEQDKVNLEEVLFYKEDIAKLDAYFHSIEEAMYDVNMERNTELKVYNTKENILNRESDTVLCVTLPYSTDWEVSVDQEKAETNEIINGFLGVKIPAGKHKVTLKYRVPGVQIGAILSIVSVMGIIFYLHGEKKRGKKR